MDVNHSFRLLSDVAWSPTINTTLKKPFVSKHANEIGGAHEREHFDVFAVPLPDAMNER